MTKPNPKLHYTLFAAILFQTALKCIYVTSFFATLEAVPKDTGLHEVHAGLLSMIMMFAGLDLLFGTFIALGIGIHSLKETKSSPSDKLSLTTQVLAWANAAFIIVVIYWFFNQLSNTH